MFWRSTKLVETSFVGALIYAQELHGISAKNDFWQKLATVRFSSFSTQ
jgi:hypothetical protein